MLTTKEILRNNPKLTKEQVAEVKDMFLRLELNLAYVNKDEIHRNNFIKLCIARVVGAVENEVDNG